MVSKSNIKISDKKEKRLESIKKAHGKKIHLQLPWRIILR